MAHSELCISSLLINSQISSLKYIQPFNDQRVHSLLPTFKLTYQDRVAPDSFFMG